MRGLDVGTAVTSQDAAMVSTRLDDLIAILVSQTYILQLHPTWLLTHDPYLELCSPLPAQEQSRTLELHHFARSSKPSDQHRTCLSRHLTYDRMVLLRQAY